VNVEPRQKRTHHPGRREGGARWTACVAVPVRATGGRSAARWGVAPGADARRAVHHV